jgi:hypothetical protein
MLRNGSVFATGVWSDRPVVTPSASNVAPASPQLSSSWLVTIANDGALDRNVQNTLTLVASGACVVGGWSDSWQINFQNEQKIQTSISITILQNQNVKRFF